MSLRRRSILFLLVVLGLVAGSIAAIALRPTVLGLDLQGGVSITVQCKPTPDAVCDEAAIQRSIDIIRSRVDSFGTKEPEIQKEGSDRISVALPGAEDPSVVEDLVKPAQLFFFDNEGSVVDQGVDLYALAKAAEKRDDAAGGRPASFYIFGRTGDHKLDACGPSGVCGPESAQSEDDAKKSLLAPFDGEVPAGGELVRVPRGYVIFTQNVETPRANAPALKQTSYSLFRNTPALLGDEVDEAAQSFDSQADGQPIVTMSFNDEGKSNFRAVTRDLAERGQRLGQNQTFAVILDGEIITTPSISYTEFPTGLDADNGVQISGDFTVDSAQTLADQINSGALPVELDVIERREVSATLGKQSLRQGLIAGLVGLILVMVFLLAFYRLMGVIAVFALVVYGLFLYAVIELMPITLTLPGIAGIILTIGVAADANVVVFERAREEARAGRTGSAAVLSAYKHAFSAIIDANLVTLLTAAILFLFSTASVKGFAFALFIGVLLSLFTAYLATRAAFGVFGDTKPFQNPKYTGINQREPVWKFDVVGKWKLWFAISFVPLAIGVIIIGFSGLNLGLEFETGTRVSTSFTSQVDENAVRDEMAQLGFPDAKVQATTEQLNGRTVEGFQIQVESLDPTQTETLRGSLDSAFGIDDETFSLQVVGPTFGEEVIRNAIIAIALSFLLIIVYLTIRFELKMAIPALISVIHDVWLTISIYSLFDLEVTSATVAAILTILGYSLYDVVIVFDRIRENLPLMRRNTYREIVNRSLHETLNRSIITGLSTLLPVVILLIFGGDTLKDFAFALTIGLLSGGLSSIAIAAPLVALWKEREPEGKRRDDKSKKRLRSYDDDIIDTEVMERAEAALSASTPAMAGSSDPLGGIGAGPVEVVEIDEPSPNGHTPDAEIEPPSAPTPPDDGPPATPTSPTAPPSEPPPAGPAARDRERRHQRIQKKKKK
jgi:SecD/SecF fusion protein